MRIVSLLPAATEILAEVGLLGRVVGVSHECDHPAAVRGRPAVTAAGAGPPGSGPTGLLSPFHVDVERLVALRPDLIVTQDLCAVCAVTPGTLAAQARDALGPDVRLCTLGATTLDGVLEDHVRVAEAAGVRAAGVAARDRLRARLDALAARPAPVPRPSVLVLEWTDPPMAGGHWTPELVAIAGGRSCLGTAGAKSVPVTWAAIAAADPEIVIVAPCGIAQAGAESAAAGVARRPEIAAGRAARAGRIFALDGSAYVNRPGPRLVETAAILAACVRGERSVAVPSRVQR